MINKLQWLPKVKYQTFLKLLIALIKSIKIQLK
jgi:hypothetical protein